MGKVDRKLSFRIEMGDGDLKRDNKPYDGKLKSPRGVRSKGPRGCPREFEKTSFLNVW